MMAQKQTNKQKGRAELQLEVNCSEQMWIQKTDRNLSAMKSIHIYDDLSIRDVFHLDSCWCLHFLKPFKII